MEQKDYILVRQLKYIVFFVSVKRTAVYVIMQAS